MQVHVGDASEVCVSVVVSFVLSFSFLKKLAEKFLVVKYA
jgi:hypothetical protein